MRDPERHREQRERREFETRVLAALEKPKANRLVRLINSPAFLWLLSLLALTIGGGFLTGYQACNRDALQTIESYQRLAREVNLRRRLDFSNVPRDIQIPQSKVNFTPTEFVRFG